MWIAGMIGAAGSALPSFWSAFIGANATGLTLSSFVNVAVFMIFGALFAGSLVKHPPDTGPTSHEILEKIRAESAATDDDEH